MTQKDPLASACREHLCPETSLLQQRCKKFCTGAHGCGCLRLTWSVCHQHRQGTAEEGFLASLLGASPLQPTWSLSQGHPQLPRQHTGLSPDGPQWWLHGEQQGGTRERKLISFSWGSSRETACSQSCLKVRAKRSQSSSSCVRASTEQGETVLHLVNESSLASARSHPHPQAQSGPRAPNSHLACLPRVPQGLLGSGLPEHDRGGSAPTRPAVMG